MPKEPALFDPQVQVAVGVYRVSDDRTVLNLVCPGGNERYSVSVQTHDGASAKVATWLARKCWPNAVPAASDGTPQRPVSAFRLCAWANASPDMLALLRTLDRAYGRVFVVTHAGNYGDRWTVQQFHSRNLGDCTAMTLRGQVPPVFTLESLYVTGLEDRFGCLTPEFLRDPQ